MACDIDTATIIETGKEKDFFSLKTGDISIHFTIEAKLRQKKSFTFFALKRTRRNEEALCSLKVIQNGRWLGKKMGGMEREKKRGGIIWLLQYSEGRERERSLKWQDHFTPLRKRERFLTFLSWLCPNAKVQIQIPNFFLHPPLSFPAVIFVPFLPIGIACPNFVNFFRKQRILSVKEICHRKFFSPPGFFLPDIACKGGKGFLLPLRLILHPRLSRMTRERGQGQFFLSPLLSFGGENCQWCHLRRKEKAKNKITWLLLRT